MSARAAVDGAGWAGEAGRGGGGGGWGGWGGGGGWGGCARPPNRAAGQFPQGWGCAGGYPDGGFQLDCRSIHVRLGKRKVGTDAPRLDRGDVRVNLRNFALGH